MIIKSKKLKNLNMNKNTYELRKKVINLLYEIKTITDIPRINVRITENDNTILGLAIIRKNIIFISKRAIENYDIRLIVYHEILHTVYGIKHNNSCPLMKETINKNEILEKSKIQKIFKKYVKGV